MSRPSSTSIVTITATVAVAVLFNTPTDTATLTVLGALSPELLPLAFSCGSVSDSAVSW